MNAGLVERLDTLLGRPVNLRALALLRVVAGTVAVVHLWPFLADARHGHIYRDRFFEPYAAWYPELPRSVYVALLFLGVGAAGLMALGVATRLTTNVTFGVVAYNLFLSTTHVHNNRAFLVIILGVLAVSPCGGEVALDVWWRRRRALPPFPTDGPGWPLWLLRFEVAVLYGASGTSKLLDPDWFGGTVTWMRTVGVRDRVVASPLPGWADTLLFDRGFHTVAAKVIIATELFLAVGLWWRATRYAAVWLAVCFHVAIQLTADVETFSYLALGTLVIWAVPSTRDRVLVVDPAGRYGAPLARLVAGLDWLARFRIETGPAGGGIRVIDRDGRVRAGPAAVAFALSRLPATAFLALPVLGVLDRRPVHRPRRDRARPAAVGGA